MIGDFSHVVRDSQFFPFHVPCTFVSAFSFTRIINTLCNQFLAAVNQVRSDAMLELLAEGAGIECKDKVRFFRLCLSRHDSFVRGLVYALTSGLHISCRGLLSLRLIW